MDKRIAGIVLTLILLAAASLAQTLPPVKPSQVKTETKVQRNNLDEVVSTTTATTPTKLRWWLPLWGADSDSVGTFYNTSSWFTAAQQVRFLYGFQQSSKSISADLTSMVFPNGIEFTLGSTVTATDDSTTTKPVASVIAAASPRADTPPAPPAGALGDHPKPANEDHLKTGQRN